VALRIVTSPATELVSLDEAKAYARVDTADDDELIRGLVRAAREHIGRRLNRSFTLTTWELVLDAFPARELQLPVAPLNEVVSVGYVDGDGVEQVLPSVGYYVDDVSEPGWIIPTADGWPATLCTANAVRVLFVAGYEPGVSGGSGGSEGEGAANVPDDVKTAAKILVAHWYDYREPIVPGQIADVPMSVEQLLGPHRIFL
jgi:uncharacterized phiE125 gp8 family phage protein